MKILLLAPEPFYLDRGTPIAVGLLLRALAERGDVVDVLTYHEGMEFTLPNVSLHRIPRMPWIRSIRPGLSLAKILCDIVLAFKALRFAVRGNYGCIHAVEESVFIALFLKCLFRIPYVYDMDSLLSRQIVDAYPRLKFMMPLLRGLERIAVRNADAVAPVCRQLADEIQKWTSARVCILQDISLLDINPDTEAIPIRDRLKIDGTVILYVGNLEFYQGIDLLLQSFAHIADSAPDSYLVIAGGDDKTIAAYKARSKTYNGGDRVHFIGPQPVRQLGGLLSQADILVSPRIRGNNTPMKIYSYLHSGRVILATALPTHTQVLDEEVSALADPDFVAFGEKMLELIDHPDLRLRLGEAARRKAEEEHSYARLKQQIRSLYGWLDEHVSRKSLAASEAS